MFDIVNKTGRFSKAMVYNIFIRYLARISKILKCVGAAVSGYSCLCCQIEVNTNH